MSACTLIATIRDTDLQLPWNTKLTIDFDSDATQKVIDIVTKYFNAIDAHNEVKSFLLNPNSNNYTLANTRPGFIGTIQIQGNWNEQNFELPSLETLAPSEAVCTLTATVKNSASLRWRNVLTVGFDSTTTEEVIDMVAAHFSVEDEDRSLIKCSFLKSDYTSFEFIDNNPKITRTIEVDGNWKEACKNIQPPSDKPLASEARAVSRRIIDTASSKEEKSIYLLYPKNYFFEEIKPYAITNVQTGDPIISLWNSQLFSAFVARNERVTDVLMNHELIFSSCKPSKA